MDFIEECAENQLFQRLCPVTEAMRRRREPQELVLRFFAYSDQYQHFQHDVEKFLDKYVRSKTPDFDRNRLAKEFENMLDFVDRYFPNGFAKSPNSSTTPRVRFEAISVGVNLALRENPNLRPGKMDWLESPEFKRHTTSHATNSRPRLRGRVEYVRDQLLAGAQ